MTLNSHQTMNSIDAMNNRVDNEMSKLEGFKDISQGIRSDKRWLEDAVGLIKKLKDTRDIINEQIRQAEESINYEFKVCGSFLDEEDIAKMSEDELNMNIRGILEDHGMHDETTQCIFPTFLDNMDNDMQNNYESYDYNEFNYENGYY